MRAKQNLDTFMEIPTTMLDQEQLGLQRSLHASILANTDIHMPYTSLRDDVLTWVDDMKLRPAMWSHRDFGSKYYYYIEFDDPEHFMLFKLAWGGQ